MASRINRERKRTSPRGSQRRPERLAEETIVMTLRAGKYPTFAQPNCSESQAMSADKHHQIWIEQCEAARTIRERYGLEAAFDYAVGEKLMNFASAAHDHPAFARELPRFVSEVRRMYSADEIRTQLARLERKIGDGVDALARHPADCGATKVVQAPQRELYTVSNERHVDLRAVDSKVGRIGQLACWEHNVPLARYALMADGEQIHSAMYPGSMFGEPFSTKSEMNCVGSDVP